MIDPAAITFVQTTFLQHITGVFGIVAQYALNILYIFAGFELVIFGLLWAFGQSGWERFFFKILKIGLIFFIIQNYTYLIDVIVRSLVQVGGIAANTQHLSHFIFNPAKIWQFGYNTGLILLKAAALNTSMGLTMILIMLGMGILVVFGFLGIQIVLQVAGFYLVSLTALIFLPFGAFNPAQGMFDSAVRSVLKAGVRVMTLIMVIGVAVTVWGSFDLMKNLPQALPSSYNITQPLGLFFTALLFLYLAIRLPQMAAEAVGSVMMRLGGETQPVVNVTQTVQQTATTSQISAVQAAATIEPSSVQVSAGAAGVAAPVSAASTVVTPVSGAGQIGGLVSDSVRGEVASGARLQKSISESTLKKLEKTLTDIVKQTRKEPQS